MSDKPKRKAPHVKATDADVAIARMQEMVRHISHQSEQILQRLELIYHAQRMVDRGRNDLPEIKSDLRKAMQEITVLKRTMQNIRWFFMGVGAAFGFLGGAVSESVRGAIKLLVG